MNERPEATDPDDWTAVFEWHRRLDAYAVAEVAGVPGLTVAAHFQGLFPRYPKLYVMARTRKGTFVCFVAAFPDASGAGTPGALKRRAAVFADFDLSAFMAFMAETETALRTGHKYQIKAFLRRHRAARHALVHPTYGEVAIYPLRLPTLVRAFGLDQTHAAYAPRRDWLCVADTGRAFGLPPTAEAFEAFMAEETERLKAAMAPARALVDIEAVGHLALATRYHQDTYHFYSRPGRHREVRRQAARAYPVFGRAMSEVDALARAIDGRRPLVPVLARTYMVAEKTIKRFKSFGHVTFPDHVDFLLFFLEDIDAGLCPARRHEHGRPLAEDQWACFASLAHHVNGLAAYIGRRKGRRAALKGLLKGFDGDWCALFAAVGGQVHDPVPPAEGLPSVPGQGAYLDPRRWAQEEERIAGVVAWDNFRRRMNIAWGSETIRDAVRAFAYAVILPQAARLSGRETVTVDPKALKLAERAAVRFVLRDRTYEQVACFAKRFHDAVGALFPATSLNRLKGANLAWAMPSGAVTTPDGLDLVPLASVQDLAEEGAALGNCLPFYTVRCAIDGRRVYAVRQGQARLGAFEVGRDDVRQPWRLGQVEGAANAPAPPAVRRAAQWYLAWLNRRGEAVAVPAPDTGGSTDVLKSLCGYDWRDDTAFEAMWALWAKGHSTSEEDEDGRPLKTVGVLPKGAVRRGLAGVARDEGFAKLLAHLRG